MGDPESMAMARSYYAQAIKLNPKNVRALYGLFLAMSTEETLAKLQKPSLFRSNSLDGMTSNPRQSIVIIS
ncbi:Hypothetical predicted protein [Mytilus galloprovincialis]|uniref:ER membrane protein complex subunit 2 n=1 Tax=Mytilus galloprovincialis TaxID=29158 RepID=A0A8B6HAW8_MYTGA|nr:Hypothetical predicted protein [Mytilus galloprovincialis]